MVRDVKSMTDDELDSEWLGCEHFINDPPDDDSLIECAINRQSEVEAEQERREAESTDGGEVDASV